MELIPDPGAIEVMPWHDQFATGFAEVDAQHRQLVAEINQLALGLATNDTEPMLAASLARLLDYAARHFATEERLWARWLGADERVAQHLRHHAGFVETIGKLRDQAARAPGEGTALDLLGFLTRWLARHILYEDHDLARRVRARQAGQVPSGEPGAFAAPHGPRVASDPQPALDLQSAPDPQAALDLQSTPDSQAALVDNLLALYELLTVRTFDLLRETHRRQQEAEALKRSQERERDLRRQQDTRQLISELASDFMAASSGEFDPAVTRILERSGEHFAADRAYVLLYDAEQRTLSNTHEWCAPGIIPQIDLVQGIPMDAFAWTWQQLERVGYVLIPDLSLLPPSAAPERELLEFQDIQSLCAFPLYQAGQLTGFVGFDAVLAQRDWGEDGVLDFGRIVSDLISIAQARSQMQQALVAARAAEARHASELRLGVLVDQGLAGVAEVDLNGYLTRVNDRYCSIVGYPREALLGRHLRDFTFAADWEREEALLARVLAGERTAILEQRFRGPAGQPTAAQANSAQVAVGLLCGTAGEPSGFLTLVTETTELKQTQERLRAITDAAHDAILMMDPQGAITYWNPAATAILGYRAEEALGQNLHRLLAPERFRAAHRQAFAVFRHSGQGATLDKTVEVAARRKDGREIVIELSLAAIALRDGWHSVGILRDITARKRDEERLRQSEQRYRELAAELEQRVQVRTAELSAANQELTRLAATDGLTGAANRRHFQEMLGREMARAQRYGSPLSLVMFDVDHFKAINDRRGHQAGDRVLVELAARVRDNLRVSDHLARWGGEEFMILLPQIDRDGALRLAEKLRSLIASAPFGEVGQVTSSFGVAEYNAGETADACLRRLDAALYAAKTAGRNRVHLGDSVGTAGGLYPKSL